MMVIAILIIYIVTGIVLYFIQDLLLFHPVALPPDHTFRFEQPFEEVNIPFNSGNLNIVTFKASDPEGIVLFFHGNRQNIERYVHYAALFSKYGYETWMMDYPGYGKSTGKRSESLIYEQALHMYIMAAQTIPADRIVLYGKSIGTGIAAQLASIKKCTKLVLETPYININALARYYFPIYPAGALVKYSFPVNKYLRQVTAAIYLLHGTRDEVIPYKQAKKLKEIKPDSRLVTIENGGHNNLYDFPAFKEAIRVMLKTPASPPTPKGEAAESE